MLSVIYTYRDRDIDRVKRSLESLKIQTVKEFHVYFVDYGSIDKFSEKIKALCTEYNFVNYSYCYTKFQPWNKSRALNTIIKNLDTEFCFVADVDMIFHPDFVKKALSLQVENKSVYFQVGFLGKAEDLPNKNFDDFKKYNRSTSEATGLSMFPVRALKVLRGFDEFYHFWGAEDTDVHERLKNAGYDIQFYDNEILMLHQWHNSYRVLEKNSLTKNLQVKNIARYNHEHLMKNSEIKRTMVNFINWGEPMSLEDFGNLKKLPVSLYLKNVTWEIDYFLFQYLPEIKNDFKVRIYKDEDQGSIKQWVKKKFRKNVPEYYSLKDINDKLLLNIIFFYRHRKYNYRIDPDLKYIEFALLSNHVS